MRKVRVNLGQNSYDICIGAGLLRQTGVMLKELDFSGKVVIITDTGLKDLYATSLKQSLSDDGFTADILDIPQGEAQKSLETAGRLYHELSRLHAERLTPILALGGGVIGDLAGFVAATYQRGVPLVQLPTTLLSQVDSSIGGKVAVNHGQLKNKIGVFYQPRLVVSDTSTLASLTDREITHGLAEVIKSAIIGDAGLFSFLETNMEQIKAQDGGALEEIIVRSARIKADTVARDEKDTGLRNTLNYGHTVGHAIETVSELGIAHGAAVAIGMIAAGRISQRMGLLSQEERDRIEALVKRAGLPTRVTINLKKDGILRAMSHDKKISGGKIRFILARRIGEVFVSDEVDLSLVEQVLGEDNG